MELGDRQLEGEALGGMGQVCERQERFDRARAHLERSVEIFRSISSRRSEGTALATLGSVQARLGMLSEARTTFASGAELLHQANDPVGLRQAALRPGRAELDAGHRDLATGLIGDAQGLADNLRSDGGSALSREIDEVRKLI